MTNQVAAKEVVRRLVSRNLIQPNEAAKVRELVEDDRANDAFRFCRVSLGQITFGWNKFWEGGTLYGWFGEVVSAEPLRLAALEIASDPLMTNDIRSYLFARWEGLTPSTLSDASARCLGELAITVNGNKLAAPDLNLLRRLNLDQRERPFIERWRWSGGSGYATLSDEGRLQIKPALVWSRGLEIALDDRGLLLNDLAEAIISADQDSDVLALSADASADRLIEKLAFFGYGERWAGGVKLTTSLNNLPKHLAALFTPPPFAP